MSWAHPPAMALTRAPPAAHRDRQHGRPNPVLRSLFPSVHQVLRLGGGGPLAIPHVVPFLRGNRRGIRRYSCRRIGRDVRDENGWLLHAEIRHRHVRQCPRVQILPAAVRRNIGDSGHRPLFHPDNPSFWGRSLLSVPLPDEAGGQAESPNLAKPRGPKGAIQFLLPNCTILRRGSVYLIRQPRMGNQVAHPRGTLVDGP